MKPKWVDWALNALERAWPLSLGTRGSPKLPGQAEGSRGLDLGTFLVESGKEAIEDRGENAGIEEGVIGGWAPVEQGVVWKGGWAGCRQTWVRERQSMLALPM